jgi:hypothetical protein
MVPETAPSYRIDARGRFIEEENIWFMHQRTSHSQALFVSKGELPGRGLRILLQTKDLLHLVHCVALPFASHPIDSGKKLKVLSYAEIAIQ